MCAWCRHTRGRFECTHGDVLGGHTDVFQRATPHPRTHHNTQGTRHNTPQEQQQPQQQPPQQHTETETEIDRERQSKKTEREDRERESLEEIVEAISAPHERVQQRTVREQTVDVPTPQILEEIVEVGSAPHERVQQRTVEQQIVDAVPHSQPQILKEVARTTSFPSINQGTKLAATHRPVVMHRRGPSDSDCLEDSGTPSDSESDLAESSDEGSAEVAKTPQTLEQQTLGQKTRSPRRLVLGSKQLGLALVARFCQLGECVVAVVDIVTVILTAVLWCL